MLSIFQKIIKVSIAILVVFTIQNNIAIGQGATTLNDQPSFSLNVNPGNSRVGESVTLTLTSTIIDLSTSKITWYVDGALKNAGNSTSYIIKTKNSGQSTIIRVVVETSDGIKGEISKEIISSGVDLIIEPTSYITPFYKGRPYFVTQGTFKVVAIPDVVVDGKRLNPADLYFKWSKDGDILGSNSGIGKNILIVNGTIPINDINISVQILDSGKNILAENSRTVISDQPKILFYENSPLYGIFYNKAITGNYFLGDKEELNVVAKPFSYNVSKDAGNETSYKWYVNGGYVVPPGKTNEILFRQTSANLKGVASVSLDLNATDPSRKFQYSSGNFNIEFGQ